MKKSNLIIVCVFAYLFIWSLSASAQWQQVGLSGQYVLSLATNGSDIFAGGGNSYIFISADNGNSWTIADSTHWEYYDEGANTIAINGSYIYAGNTYQDGTGDSPLIGYIIRSTDNGISWAETFGGWPPITSIVTSGSNLFAATGGYGIGGGGYVFMSKDSGNNWILVNDSSGWEYISALAVKGNSIFAASFYGMYKSTNNGGSWTLANNGLGGDVASMAISDSSIFAGTGFGEPYGKVYLSTNDGVSWTSISNGLPESTDYVSIAVNDSNIFAGSLDYGVYLSTDNGVSWKEANYGFADTSMAIFSLLLKDSAIYAGTTNGVWRRSLKNILAVENISAVDYGFTIYPNPSNNQLTIHTLLKDEHATISIINILGQKASPPAPLHIERGDALIDPVGYSSYGIDVSKLAAGIYFLQLKTEGGSVVRKFVKE